MTNRPTLEELRSAIEEMESDMGRVVALPVPGEERLSAALAFGYVKRGINTLRAVRALSRANLGSEIGAQTRVVTESAIYLAWILQRAGVDRPLADRELRAQEVWDSQVFDEEKRRRLWAVWDYATPEDVANAHCAIQEIRQRRGLKPEERLELKLNNLAAEAGGGFGQHYDLAFRINCLDSHPTLDSILRAIADEHDFSHSRSLFITCMSGMGLNDAGYQLMGRGDEFVALRNRVAGRIGLPPEAFAPAGNS